MRKDGDGNPDSVLGWRSTADSCVVGYVNVSRVRVASGDAESLLWTLIDPDYSRTNAAGLLHSLASGAQRHQSQTDQSRHSSLNITSGRDKALIFCMVFTALLSVVILKNAVRKLTQDNKAIYRNAVRGTKKNHIVSASRDSIDKCLMGEELLLSVIEYRYS